ncbi:MAG: Excinuclease ABC subunit B [Candidatus Woesebacteria bacterium GW2011_GWA1_37_8]|uniref:UvrABC system protein B n=1 Tax=Candidatus Woesebacteria bacterium GW2011_GWA1_37_8 TaxID=1618546 RepID=A0A0G0HM93_9BACT|nr:MAG: Excinuclease ABC subunit B [Microgenomates group bacterium GW2011_GWC1_37_12b]KKQ43352.1 MAG: Excinuclease ABC subunit B [Candidatus Woesebacteria bacterium GW2011_GWA1_37_8]
MNKFKIKSEYDLIEDQKNAVEKLSKNISRGIDNQVLLGVTGSGKTFTIANVIERTQLPTLILSHNKTLAAQLYQEFRDFFPENAVSYFVSYYDYYQPEAYIPSTDTYIEKDSDINDLIDKLRLGATTNLLTRPDVIVVASVSCIYNIGSPVEYGKFIFEFARGIKLLRKQIIDRLIDLQYERSEFGFHRGTFRLRGENIDIFPAYQDEAIRIRHDGNFITDIELFDPVSGTVLSEKGKLTNYVLYPAKHFITDPLQNKGAIANIKSDLQRQVDLFNSEGKFIEAQRISQRVKYDLEMLSEVGYVKGIENYSRYFDGRNPGDAPYSLLDYFKKSFGDKWLLVADESHITFPQVRGMYAGDLSRKKTLIDYGFRLPAAIDNRPLKFEEFIRRIPRFIATSATPDEWELNNAYQSAANAYNNNPKENGVTEQLVRPTGIPDPLVEIRPIKNQVKDVIEEIIKITKKGQRTLVTTLTKKTAEDLSEYLGGQGIKVNYLHSDIDTLERTDILDNLRRGKFDVIVGVNLLREGLDLPEVSLVAILDADKEGFLRSRVSLIQTMGRAARHVEGKVILYADKRTKSIEAALSEIDRRRAYQVEYNKIHNITPTSIQKPLRNKVTESFDQEDLSDLVSLRKEYELLDFESSSLTPMEQKKLIAKLRREMRTAADDLNFELAIAFRDKIKQFN